jgi:hypothetical protein
MLLSLGAYGMRSDQSGDVTSVPLAVSSTLGAGAPNGVSPNCEPAIRPKFETLPSGGNHVASVSHPVSRTRRRSGGPREAIGNGSNPMLYWPWPEP